ncbi:MAG: hypothetical protein LKK03_01395 [Candidatus Methanomethylophilus sp.]|jgi:hypothetical protein|nr:hypothetical protein [Methanomethylophilus sp.]
MTLYAVNVKTGVTVPVGSEIIDFRGDRATLVSLDRVNECRYGGCRSGKVTAKWQNGHCRSVYDKVFGLEIRDTDLEARI